MGHVHPRQHRRELVDLVLQQQGVAVRPGQRRNIEKRLGPFGQTRQHRLQVQHQQAEHVQGGGADLQHFLLAAFFLGQRPGRLVGDVAVGVVGQLHDLAHGLAEFALLIEAGDGGGGLLRFLDQQRVVRMVTEGTAELLDEVAGAAGDIDHLAHQVGIHPLGEVLQVEVEIVHPVVELGGEVIAQVFRIEMVQVGARLDKGAPGLGHLGAVDGDEAVAVDRRGFTQPGAIQHGRPEQAVEVDDVLADKVVKLGVGIRFPVFVEVQAFPVAQILEAGHVADGRVQPDIEILARVTGDLEAEVGRFPGDVPGLQVLDPFLQLVGDAFLQ